MKLVKKLVSILLIFILIMSISAFSSSAAGANAIIAVSSTNPTVGSNITVTVTYSASNIGAAEGYLTYNSSVLQYVSGSNTSGASGKVRMSSWSNSAGANSISFKMTFKVIGAGASQLIVSGSNVWDFNEQLVGNPGASASVAAKAAGTQQASSNALLNNLVISSGKLSPAFSANTFTYNVTVPFSVTSVIVTAYPADSSAKWDVEGSKDMKVGNNQRVVVVTAPDGTVKRYTINILRQGEDGSSDTSSSQPETPTDNNIKITTHGVEYTLCQNFESITAPQGFAADISNYAGNEIPVFKSESGNEIVVLEDSEGNKNLFLYMNSDVSFYKLSSINLGGREYLFVGNISNDETEDFEVKEIKLGENAVQVFHKNDLPDDTVCLYAINSEGELKLYLYDTKDDLLMRYDLLPKTTEKTPTENKKTEDNNMMMYLNISVVSCAVLLVVVIVLIIVLIASKRKKRPASLTKEVPVIDDDELKF